MPRSLRHKSNKQSKHSSKGYSDSEEDVKIKEKSSRDEILVRAHRALTSGEKRKLSSQVREIKDGRDLSGRGNGEVTEEHVLLKRRKEKADIGGVVDRWNGAGKDRGDTERNGEKEVNIGEILKVDSQLKESINRGESLRIELKSKSKRYESGSVGERKEESLAPTVMEKEESKSKGGSKRKSEKDSSGRKEGLESKDKDRRSETEKNGGLERKVGDAELNLADMNVGKKQGSQSGNLTEERQGKLARENTERPVQDELHNPEVEKETEKRILRRREGSSERDKHYYDFKDGEARLLSSRGDLAKDMKCKDDKQKNGNYADKYEEDGHKDDKKRDEQYHVEPDKDNKHRNEKHREEGVKDAKRRDDRHRKDGDRDNRCKDEKHREDGERDSRRKDDKYQEDTERDGPHRNDKYLEDGERGRRRKDDRYRGDGYKEVRRSGEKYYEDGERDDRCRDYNYRENGDRDNRHKEDIERDNRHEESKQGDEFDKEQMPRDSKYRDEPASRDQSGDKFDTKRSRDDGYTADHHSEKSSAYDDSIAHKDRKPRYRDNHIRRRTIEKEDYDDNRSRSTKDQISVTEKKSVNSARTDPVTDKGRSTHKNAEPEFTSSHSRRRSSPSNSYAPRDTYRVPKQDESKYKDYNLEERVWHNTSRDYAGAVGGTEKTSSSRSLKKLGEKDDGHLGELSAERRLKSDIRASPLQLVDKSPSSSTDRRQLSWSDARRSIDVEVSTQRSGGSRDVEYLGKESRGSRELTMDVLAGDNLSQADADASSVSSPFMRNNRFSSSKSFLPPPPLFRTGVDSSSMLGFSEDDSRGKSNSRHRRIGDPNMGRIQGNAWRGVPSWPSPVANGFLPFPHAPSFHSLVQPFPPPPMFGVRPSMELNHPAPYHMPEADRFSGRGHPIGWHNQVDDSCPPLPAWDASNAVFGDESHIYGRPDWHHSRNLPGGRGWESSEDLWKGPNRTASLEMPSSENENISARSADGALAGQSFQPAQNDETRTDQQAESTDISQTKSFENKYVEAPLSSLEETDDVSKMSRKDDVRLCHVYLSKLDISADLAEPELYNQCTGIVDMDQSIFSDVGDSKVLYMEEAVEAKAPSIHKILSYTLFAAVDDSVFQKAMSLYKRQKGNFRVEREKEVGILNQLIPNSDQEDPNVKEDDIEKLCSTDDMQGAKNALSNFKTEVDPLLSAESVEGSDAPLPSEVKVVSVDSTRKNEEPALLVTKCVSLLNSDVSSEAIMPESIVSGSVNLSRIHHSPESTH